MKLGTDGFVFIGGDLAPETVLEAYSKGVFPWDGRKPYPWFSPDPRLVLVPPDFRASHSLRKLARQGRLQVRYDTDLVGVMRGCASTPERVDGGTWITDKLISVYRQLFARGIAHSVEVYDDGRLVGGLYGMAVGRVFFGESMFALRRDASKLGFYDLCQRLSLAEFHLVDCQADTPHLRSLGARLIPRTEYLARLREAWSGSEAWAEAMRAPGVIGRRVIPEG